VNKYGTSYSVKGFRSLLDFEIKLKSGLNILVGPNGSGKTNFIEFLDFIDALIRNGASYAISQSGGVARVFSVENFKKATPSLECEITGRAELFDAEFSHETQRKFKFKYFIEIKFSKKNSQIYISREKISFFKLDSEVDSPVSSQFVGAISVKRSDVSEFNSPIIEIGPRLYSSNQRNPFSLRRRIHRGKSTEELFERTDFQSIDPDQSVIQSRRIFPALDAVRQVITRGKSLNIIPDRARAPDHISAYPLIERDGAGLSASLYHLKKLRNAGASRAHPALRSVDPESFDMIVNWTSLVFPELNDIYITQDLHAGKYLVQLQVSRQKNVRIPLQAASDGTIKWLSLVSLVVMKGGPSCLEEPENFLHPKMQTFLMDLLRESFDPEERENYFILSTHSETIINNCSPEDIVVFGFSSKGTACRRIENPENVRREINKTGFGLGYYYASNAI
jgi:predicted ATPase